MMTDHPYAPTGKVPGQFEGGFVRTFGARGVGVSQCKPEDLPPIADPIAAQERLLAKEDPEVASKAMRPVQARRTKLACLGVPSDILDKGNPLYARNIRLANSYKKARVKEFFLAHGHVSSGVHSLLASASLALAVSRFLFSLATSSEETGFMPNTEYMKTARAFIDSARQNELAAWELCSKESVIKRRNDNNSQTAPWIVQMSGDYQGEVKRPRGRPRKALTNGQ